MNFLELVKKRYSVREFLAKDIEQEKIDYIVETVRLAPSAVNKQPWKLFFVTEKKVLQELATCYSREWFKTAPACFVVCGNHSESWHRFDGKDHCDVDISIAVEHLVLAAAEQGLGSCWVCNFDMKKCSEVMNLSEEWEPIALIPIGYATSATIPEKKRKSLNEIFEVIG